MTPILRFCVLTIVCFHLTAKAQVAYFPAVTCENMNGEQKVIPQQGKYQLMVIAFGKQNEKELQSWLQPLYDKFIAKTSLIDFIFDADLYLLSILNGLEASAAKANKNKIKQEVDEELQPKIFLFQGDQEKLLKDLNIDSKQLYVFLMDANGKIIYKTSGKYSEAKMEAIEDAFD